MEDISLSPQFKISQYSRSVGLIKDGSVHKEEFANKERERALHNHD